MPDTNLGGYYNRFDPLKNYDAHLFRAGKVLQSAELNEVQSAAHYRLQSIADVLFKDGDVVRDAQAIVNADSGAVQCQSGAIYLSGAVRGVEPAEFVIATVGLVTLGIYLNEYVIDELDDPALRDPATGTRNYEEPGAVRRQIVPRWGFAGDGQAGEFYPVYTVEDGVLRAKEAPPQLDSVTQALARYDRDSAGGTYIVDGLYVGIAADTADGQQVYTVSEGRARVNGYGVELPTSRRLVYAATPDVRFIDSEPHQSVSAEAQRITLDRPPAGEITQVRITTEKTTNITHGSFTGASDALPDTAVLAIISVSQSSTTYAAGSDYKLTAGKVDWSPSGAEPAPGSTYSVTYQYIASVAPDAPDDTGFSVTGAVEGSLVMTSYNTRLPRYDRLCLTPDGAFVWITGVAADYTPIVPRLPNDLLLLVTVVQTWRETGADARRLSRDSVRTVPMQELYAVNEKLDHILGLVAQQRLEASANMIEAGTKKGLFVDPLLDDSMRDLGVEQTALVYGGQLMLPIDADASTVSGDLDQPATLTFSPALALEQTLRTTDMKINPYQAFAQPPLPVTLTPAVDHFVETQTTTQSGVAGTTSTSEQALPYLRQREVAFRIDSWNAGELLASVDFDGIAVTPTGVTYSGGTVLGSFMIPPNVPTGTKLTVFTGDAGSAGQASYVGTHTQQTVITFVYVPASVYVAPEEPVTMSTADYNNWWWASYYAGSIDPLAQTFTLERRVQLAAVELWFAVAGTQDILLQIRETSLGMPSRGVRGSARFPAASLLTNGQPTRIPFPAPVTLEADTEYALVVMTVDADSSVRVAELGKYDATVNKWVTSQPYQVGTLLSSSNASTWTPHQDRDLAFRLLSAEYAPLTRTVDLGTVAVDGVTDLLLLAAVEIPDSAARALFDLSIPGTGVLTVSPGQPVKLTTAVSGDIGIAARLEGSAGASPILYPGTQLAFGTVAGSAEYISRGIPAGQNARVRVIFDALIPGGAAVAVAVAGIDPDDTWADAGFSSASPVDEGFVEQVYEVPVISEDMVRVKLALSGDTTARPVVKNLRVIVT
jgi:hypothetical protein